MFAIVVTDAITTLKSVGTRAPLARFATLKGHIGKACRKRKQSGQKHQASYGLGFQNRKQALKSTKPRHQKPSRRRRRGEYDIYYDRQTELNNSHCGSCGSVIDNECRYRVIYDCDTCVHIQLGSDSRKVTVESNFRHTPENH